MVTRRRSPRLNPLSASSASASSVSSSITDSEGDDTATENEAPPKRGRGRPKKTKVETSSSSSSIGNDDDVTTENVAPPKRGRGRPRKATPETSETESASEASSNKRRKSSRATVVPPKKKKEEETKAESVNGDDGNACLPRTRELSLKAKHAGDSTAATTLHVLGIDEAGRGPLAGPVCAAAVILPQDVPGITDSKKITKEEQREELYGSIMAVPGVRWAAAVVDAKRIDEINILQATMQAMRMAAEAVVVAGSHRKLKGISSSNAAEATVDRLGCYVVCGANDDDGNPLNVICSAADNSAADEPSQSSYLALVDGNRVPSDMPCEAEAMVKGDSSEFSIAAASIIAKVTRDRLMNAYADRYPEYNLAQHKGYPTAAHMAAVRRHGASPIHRRTFAPLKHMTFDDQGQIVED